MTDRQVMQRWTAAFSILITAFLFVISLRFFEYMPEIDSAFAWLFITTGVFSHFALICSVVALFVSLLTIPLSYLPTSLRLLKPLVVALAAIGCFLLIADSVVYAQYRFHISGFVIDMMLQGGNDIIALSWLTWLVTILVCVACIGLVVYFSKLASTLSNRANWKRLHRTYLALFALSLLGSNFIHLYADATYDQRITSLVRHIPMFSPLTGKKALLNSGLVDAESIRADRQEFKVKTSSTLDYPKEPISTSIDADTPNILLIVVDSLRFDMIEPDIMPTAFALQQGKNSLNFNQHFSGGNSTRTGIFNLFYGLPGTYWTAFATNQVSPVLMSTFLEHGYHTEILAAAPLTQPAFDRTVFADIDNLKLKAEGDTPWQKDVDITENWLQFVERRQAQAEPQAPFFGMLFYDGVHGFSVPEQTSYKFEPSWRRVDHIALNDSFDPTPYFNLYKNAANQVDAQISRVMAQLKRTGLMDNTIVIFTSDHGQEFNDNKQNYWGHGSNFTDIQVKVPLIVHWPNEPTRSYQHRTSHSDISVTLMEDVFNTTNQRTEYSLGQHLTDKKRDNWTIVGSYVNYAIKEPKQHTVTYPNGSYEILDSQGKSLEGGKLSTDIALKAMKMMSEFYK